MQSAALANLKAGITARTRSAAWINRSLTAHRAPIDLEAYRPALTRYALRALSDAEDAQDAVHDTMHAAIALPDAFEGRSSPKTWLFGILKHKIIDIYRRRAREVPLSALPGCETQEDIDALFTPDGSWREPPASWGNPETALEQRDFLATLDGCIACLPERAASVFRMREVMELEVSEICDALDISPNHCYVLLHRARMTLRVLLEQRWFAPNGSASN